MPVIQRLKDYLDSQQVHYEVLGHQEAYEAPEIARALQVLGESLAKVIMVKVKDRFVMTVLPSTWKVDLKRLKDVFQTSRPDWRLRRSSRGSFQIVTLAPCRRLATSTV